MNDFELALKDVKEELYSEPVVQEYFRLLMQIKSDEHLTMLDKKMREHQKKMCENINSDEIYHQEKKAYEDALNEMNNNPLYINFLQVKEEVMGLLNEIKDALQ